MAKTPWKDQHASGVPNNEISAASVRLNSGPARSGFGKWSPLRSRGVVAKRSVRDVTDRRGLPFWVIGNSRRVAIVMAVLFFLELCFFASAIGRDLFIGLAGLAVGVIGVGLAIASVIYHSRKSRSSR